MDPSGFSLVVVEIGLDLSSDGFGVVDTGKLGALLVEEPELGPLVLDKGLPVELALGTAVVATGPGGFPVVLVFSSPSGGFVVLDIGFGADGELDFGAVDAAKVGLFVVEIGLNVELPSETKLAFFVVKPSGFLVEVVLSSFGSGFLLLVVDWAVGFFVELPIGSSGLTELGEEKEAFVLEMCPSKLAFLLVEAPRTAAELVVDAPVGFVVVDSDAAGFLLLEAADVVEPFLSIGFVVVEPGFCPFAGLGPLLVSPAGSGLSLVDVGIPGASEPAAAVVFSPLGVVGDAVPLVSSCDGFLLVDVEESAGDALVADDFGVVDEPELGLVLPKRGLFVEFPADPGALVERSVEAFFVVGPFELTGLPVVAGLVVIFKSTFISGFFVEPLTSVDGISPLIVLESSGLSLDPFGRRVTLI